MSAHNLLEKSLASHLVKEVASSTNKTKMVGGNSAESSQSIVDELFKEFISKKIKNKNSKIATSKDVSKPDKVDEISKLLDLEISSIQAQTKESTVSEKDVLSNTRRKEQSNQNALKSRSLSQKSSDEINNLSVQSDAATIPLPSSSMEPVSKNGVKNNTDLKGDVSDACDSLSGSSLSVFFKSVNSSSSAVNSLSQAQSSYSTATSTVAATVIAKGVGIVGKKINIPKQLGCKLSTESLSLIKSNEKIDRRGRVWEDGEVPSSHSEGSNKEESESDDGFPSDTGSIHSDKDWKSQSSSKHKKKHKHKHKKKKKKKSSKERDRSKTGEDEKDRSRDSDKDKASSKKDKGKEKSSAVSHKNEDDKTRDKERSERGKENQLNSELTDEKNKEKVVSDSEISKKDSRSSDRDKSDNKRKDKDKKRKRDRSRSKSLKCSRRSRSRSKSPRKSKRSPSPKKSRYSEWDARNYSSDSKRLSRSRSRSGSRGRSKRKRSSEQKRDKSSERKRDRSSERKRDRSSERKRDKSSERKRDRSSERKRDRSSERKRDRSSERKRDRSSERKRDRSSERKRDRSSERKRDKAKENDNDLRLQIDKAKLRKIAIANALSSMKTGQSVPVQLDVATVKSGGKSVEELTDFCKRISEKEQEKNDNAVSDSSEEEMAAASDDEEPLIHHPFKVKDVSSNIIMNIRNSKQLPVLTPSEKQAQQATLRLAFPVSSGSHHRANESEWVPVERTTAQSTPTTNKATNSIASSEAQPEPPKSIFKPPSETKNMDIGAIISERLQAVRKLQANPYDVQALSSMHKAQEKASQWAQSKHLPGQFIGTTGAQIMSQEQLMGDKRNQAWVKKSQFDTAAPVNSGIGMFLLQKMGWKQGEGLGKNHEGSTEPLKLDIKIDRKGLSTAADNPRAKPQVFNVPKAKDLSHKHPVSALMELCNKRRWSPPCFTIVSEDGPDHKKYFIFKVKVNNVEYQPAAPSSNKKSAKAQCAAICLQEMGLLPRDASVSY